MKFVVDKVDSSASPLYLVKAIDDNGNIDMQWHVACDDEQQIEIVARQAYEQTKLENKGA